MRFFALYVVTAVAEILGCYSVYLWLKGGRPVWWLVPAVISLGVFSWLLTLHPAASGRVYAAYGGVYIAASILWLWLVDGVRPDRWDVTGSAICVVGALMIYCAPRA